MCCVRITPTGRMTQAQADFVGCLLTAVLTAAPYFMSALLDCLTAPPEPPPADDSYNPGDRARCNA